ncbi:hypothetical protein AHAS_Ahas17G0119400 [Arachis hypogaea]
MLVFHLRDGGVIGADIQDIYGGLLCILGEDSIKWELTIRITFLIGLLVTNVQFIWQPYMGVGVPDDLAAQLVMCSTQSPLLSFECIEWHPTDRVRRQCNRAHGARVLAIVSPDLPTCFLSNQASSDKLIAPCTIPLAFRIECLRLRLIHSVINSSRDSVAFDCRYHRLSRTKFHSDTKLVIFHRSVAFTYDMRTTISQTRQIK